MPNRNSITSHPRRPDVPASFTSSLAYSADSSWATTSMAPSDAGSLRMERRSIVTGETSGDHHHNDCTQAVLLTCLHLSHEMALRDVGLYAWTLPHVKDPQGSTMRIMKHYSEQLQDLSPHRSLSIRMSPDPSKTSIQHNVQKARLAAKPDEYIAIFYSGHGIQEPPTEAGELWCFDRSFEECAQHGGGPSEYIPILLFDMLTWAGANTCYVWDSHHAGLFIKAAYTEATEIDTQLTAAAAENPNVAAMHPAVYSKRQIHFAACGPNETIPRINGLPDDLFTSCLITPLRVALLHHNLQDFPITTGDRYSQKSNGYMTALLQNMSVQLQDKLEGELRAILLKIASQTIEKEAFDRLFKSGDVVAGLASGFLLAQRVLGAYRTNPEAIPHIPSSTTHPLWTTWDMIMDDFFAQLPLYFDEERGSRQNWEKDLQLVEFKDDQLNDSMGYQEDITDDELGGRMTSLHIRNQRK